MKVIESFIETFKEDHHVKDVSEELSGTRQAVPTEIYPPDEISGMWKVFKGLGGHGLVTKSDVQKTIVNRMCAWRPGCIAMAKEDQQREAELPGLPLTGPFLKQRLYLIRDCEFCISSIWSLWRSVCLSLQMQNPFVPPLRGCATQQLSLLGAGYPKVVSTHGCSLWIDKGSCLFWDSS